MKLIFSIFVLTMAPAIAFAQPAAPAAPQPVTSPATHAPSENLQPYVQPTYTNLARTLWALNVHDNLDDVAIDNFLKISECGLYTKFFTNEFEWKRVREATRAYLKQYKHSFPRRYEYVQPLMLDRYDFALKGFGLMPESDFPATARIEMGKKLGYNPDCPNMQYDGTVGYPTAMMLVLKQPFKLSFVRVNEELAQEYLKLLSDKNVEITNGRPAYIRFRVRLDRYVGTDDIGQDHYAVFAGALETIEVFADRDLMFKMYEQSFY